MMAGQLEIWKISVLRATLTLESKTRPASQLPGVRTVYQATDSLNDRKLARIQGAGERRRDGRYLRVGQHLYVQAGQGPETNVHRSPGPGRFVARLQEMSAADSD